ncbi:MAG: ParA family protein [Caldilineae bacterium]|nr:MAG: ParA family protein [Caldilineae bacterium]
MTLVIAISNLKGGVAKTTTCLSLGAALAEMGHSVLLVDLDPQAHLTLSLGFKPARLHRTSRDALLGHTSLVAASRESEVFALDIVPANQELALLNKILYTQPGYEFHLKKRLQTLPPNLYEVVLLDCPPSIDVLTINALTAADRLLIPVQCEYYAARSLQQVLELAKRVQQRTNPRLQYQILVTMYDRRNKICRLILDQLRANLNPLLLHTIIEVDTKLRESPAFGQPVTVYAPHTRGAEQYRALAQELMNHA